MKSLRNILLLAGLLLGGHLGALGQIADWMRGMPVGSGAGMTSHTTDAAGNTYVSGMYANTFHIWGYTCAGSPINQNDNDCCIIKFNASGTVQWATAGSGLGNEYLTFLTPDAAGNLFCLLRVTPSNIGPTSGLGFSFGGQTVASQGTYIVKMLPTGSVADIMPIDSVLAGNTCTGLAVDAAGNCYTALDLRTGSVLTRISRVGGRVTGQRLASFTVNPIVSSPPVVPAFNVKFIKTGPQGDLYCAGELSGNLVTPTGVSITRSDPAMAISSCVVRLTAAGTLVWGAASSVQNPPLISLGMNIHAVSDLAVDAAGNAYLTGVCRTDNVAFGTVGTGPMRPSYYTAKISAAGQPQWVRGVGGCTAGVQVPACDIPHVGLAVDAAGNSYQTGALSAPRLTFGDTTSIAHSTTGVYLVSYSSSGARRWVRSLPISPGSYNALAIDANANLYFMGTAYLGNRFDQQVCTTPGGVIVKLVQAAILEGKVYLDANANGRFDGGESSFPRSIVVAEANQQQAFSSDPGEGKYHVFGSPGAYALNLAAVPPHYALRQPSPNSYTGSFPAVGQTTNGLDFGLAPIPNQADVRATLTPYGAARPGFLTRYRLTLENVGTTAVASGTATATLDGRAAYVSSAPSGTRAGQTITWAYANLAPFARREFDVLFSLPVNTALGTVLSSTATAPLPADVVPADNTSTATQTVTGSFDPNDIQVNYSRLTPTQVAAGQPLDYTIRFQNMGTDTAFTVVIKDTLNFRKLNLGSLMLVAQSHNCQWSLSGQGELTVRFLNIRLPHRGIDVIRSQGFVRFRVLPRPSLAVGDIIPNHAHIVFDYNAPIRTNTATTAVLLPTAVAAARPGLAWEVYPNPARETVTLAAELPAAGPVRVQVLDALGRVCQTADFAAPAGPLRQALDVRDLQPGLYLLRLQLPGGQTSSRALLRE